MLCFGGAATSSNEAKQGDINNVENRKKNIASAVVLLAFVVLAIGSTDTDTDTQEVQSQEPSYTLSAEQLYDEYDSNEVAADGVYKGKVIVVSGTIQDIGKDIMDEAYIIIGGQGFLDGVQCYFTEAGLSTVSQLSKGDFVTVKGEVQGKMGNVVVRKSSLQ